MICMTMIEHDIFHTRMILCHDMLHGVGLLYLEEVYYTVKVARVAQDDCGPTSGFATYTVTGSFAAILILAALLRCYYWQLCCDIGVLAGWVDFIPT
ncbi:hypothetical protein Gotur_007026 [Gossypium turneri]